MDIQRPNLGEWQKNEADRQKTRTAMLVDPLKKIYKYMFIELILAAFVTLLTVIMVASGDGLDIEGASALLIFLGLLGWVSLAISVMILLEYKKAGEYDYGFETVFKLYLTILILKAVSTIATSPVDNLVDIAQLIVGIVYTYNLYEAFADVVRPVSASTADKWKGFFKFYIISCVITFIGSVYTVIKAVSADSYVSAWNVVGMLLWVVVIDGIVSVIISIVELVYLNETTKKMQIAATFSNGSGRSM